MYKCSRCGEEKSRDDFWKNRHTRTGLSSYCIACDKARKGRRITPTHLRKRKGVHTLPPDGITLVEKQKRIAQLKETTPCACCGEFHPPKCMDYHHIDDATKSFSISSIRLQKAGSISMERILEEINKCLLVCAVCHRKIHAGLIELLPTS